MRVLFVTTVPPWPLHGGASLRAYHLLRGLAANHEVEVACFATVSQELALREAMPFLRAVHTVRPPEPRSLWWRALQTVVSPQPDLALRGNTPVMEELLQRLLQRGYDIVHILGMEAASSLLPLLPTFKRSWRARLVLDELNAEYQLQERAFRMGVGSPTGALGASYSLVQSVKLRHYEQQVCEAVDGVVAVSDEDAALLHELAPLTPIGVVPNGVDTSYYRPWAAGESAPALPLPAEGRIVLFTGTMDFRPNVDAVQWLARDIWPKIVLRTPGAHLAIVGRDPTPAIMNLRNEHITVTGLVPDDLPYFWRADLYVLPMRFGGGSRLKLLQALACGLPIVSTSMGAEGVAVVDGEHLLLADRPRQFAAAATRLLHQPELAQRLGARARAQSLNYDWERVIGRLETFYQQLLSVPVAR